MAPGPLDEDRRESIVGLWQDVPEVQPQPDFMAPVVTAQAQRFDDASVSDPSVGIARNIHDAAALERESV